MTKDRWLVLMGALGIESATDCYQALYNAYSEKHRFYHSTQHIDAMLKHFDAVHEMAERPHELELAIWFHDAIYKPLSSTNELDSAKWAQAFLTASGYAVDGIERIFSLIMATLHNGSVQGNDEKLIVDIDLTILGAAPHVYDEFEQNVRKEYKIVPSLIYRKKRKEVLNSFLSHASIYHLDYFKDKYEQAARQNIHRAIQKL